MVKHADTEHLTLAVIEDLKGKGYTQSEIARMFGKSRQAVSWHKATYGGRMTPREQVLKNFPWHVSAEQAQSSPYRRMRDHGEYVATGGVGMSDDKLRRLRAFYDKLIDDNLVLEFDPAIPPKAGVTNKGGFAFRKRSPRDAGLMIRKNKHTTITEEGKRIWKIPPTLP